MSAAYNLFEQNLGDQSASFRLLNLVDSLELGDVVVKDWDFVGDEEGVVLSRIYDPFSLSDFRQYPPGIFRCGSVNGLDIGVTHHDDLPSTITEAVLSRKNEAFAGRLRVVGRSDKISPQVIFHKTLENEKIPVPSILSPTEDLLAGRQGETCTVKLDLSSSRTVTVGIGGVELGYHYAMDPGLGYSRLFLRTIRTSPYFDSSRSTTGVAFSGYQQFLAKSSYRGVDNSYYSDSPFMDGGVYWHCIYFADGTNVFVPHSLPTLSSVLGKDSDAWEFYQQKDFIEGSKELMDYLSGVADVGFVFKHMGAIGIRDMVAAKKTWVQRPRKEI